jgi:hypothetical protein
MPSMLLGYAEKIYVGLLLVARSILVQACKGANVTSLRVRNSKETAPAQISNSP